MPFASIGGLRLAYQSFGAERAPALVLVAGLGAQMLQWPETLCQLLVERGFRVLRFDNRDAGRSSRLDELGTPDLRRAAAAWRGGRPLPPPYRLEDMADDLLTLLDSLGLARVHLAGVSVGGMVAQSACLRHPERFLSLTSILSAAGSRDLPAATKIALSSYSEEPPADEEAFLAQTLQLRRALAGPRFPIDEAWERRLAGRLWRRGIHPAGTARQLAAFYAYERRTAELRRLRPPTLVIHGDRDPLVPLEEGVRTARTVPGARLLVFAGMGHDLPRPLWPHLAAAIATQLS